MRPLTLRVAGLRSYRRERTLDFTDRSLIAILGDTGSGKSSLLEALFAALYGGSTWEGRGLSALIADGVKTLQIHLEFQARGHKYTVSRSTSRDNHPPAKHVLKGPAGEHVEGDRNVTARIEQIVGLTAQEFLRVVILPQGRFGQLLQGTPGERTPILRGILNLSILDRVREAADQQSSELAQALEPLTEARARLYPDPSAVAIQAENAAANHRTRRNKLKAAADDLVAIASSTMAVEQALPAVNAALVHAQTVNLQASLAALKQADLDSTTLDTEVTRLRAERAQHEAVVADVGARLAAAAAQGFTPGAIGTARASFDQIVTELPSLHVAALENAKTGAELATSEQALVVGELEAETAAEKADQAARKLAGLEIDARHAANNVRDARRQLSDLDKNLGLVAQRGARLETLARGMLEAVVVLRESRALLTRARQNLETARSEHEDLRASNRAAHVASGHKPGDPCPVCHRGLPTDFVPAVIVGEDDLKRTETAAEATLAKADADERTAERALDAERQELLTATSSLAESAAQAAETMTRAGWSHLIQAGETWSENTAANIGVPQAHVDTAVRSLLTSRKVDDDAVAKATSLLAEQLREHATAAVAELKGFDANSPQAQILLTPLVDGEVVTQAALDQGKVNATALATHATTVAATLTAAIGQHEKDKLSHQTSLDRTTQHAARLAHQVQALPAILADPLSRALNLAAADPAQALLAARPLPAPFVQELQAALSGRAVQLDDWNAERDAERDAIAVIGQQLAVLADTRRSRVDVPRTAGRTTLERAAAAVRALTGSLPALDLGWKRLAEAIAGQPPLTGPASELSDDLSCDVDDVELTNAATAMAGRLEQAYATLSALRAGATVGLRQAHDRIATVLAEANVPTVEALTAQLAAASHQLNEAQALLQRARTQQPVAAELDEGLTTLKRELAVLRVVKDVMNPSLFPKYVVQQRQTALLRIASTLLAKLTRDAYGFGDDFMIVDRRTGQPRHAKTLSGGETFLASLALALALVEISNRSGGQLDALFLDEGFGSLDASILGDALDVLRQQATDGRLVGVISHLHAVAAELDDVLVVTKGIDGSDFRWLDARERDNYLLDDVSAGLLS